MDEAFAYALRQEHDQVPVPMKINLMTPKVLLTTAAAALAGVVTFSMLPMAPGAQPDASVGSARHSETSHALLPYVKPVALIQRSAVIVEGVVAASDPSVWNADQTMLYTDYRIVVSKVLKGPQDLTMVTVRNAGGIDPDSQQLIEVGDAPRLEVGNYVLLLLSTENLAYLDMTEGQQYYVTAWAGGAYVMTPDNQLVHQLHPEFNESVADFEARVTALLQGLPDPKPLPGLPIFDTEEEGVLP